MASKEDDNGNDDDDNIEQSEGKGADSGYMELALNIQGKINNILHSASCKVPNIHKDTLVKYLGDLMNLFSKQDTEIALLKTKLESASAFTAKITDAMTRESKRTYAETVKRERSRSFSRTKSKEHVLLIYPKDENAQSEHTEKEIINKLNPTKLKIGVKRMKRINKGGVLIQTSTEHEMEKLKIELVDSKLDTDFTIASPKKFNPSIIVFDVEDSYKGEELAEVIAAQNDGLEVSDLDVKFPIRSRKQGYNNWVIQMLPDAFATLSRRDKINLKWRRYTFKEHFRITQCYKCAEYGHLARNCKNAQICRNCSNSDHLLDNCSQEVFCINCHSANQKFNLNLDNYHSPYSRNCPQYQRLVNRLSKRTNYGQ